MSLTTRSIYTANPSTFNAMQTGVSIGDFVVDPAGLLPPGLIKGPNSARTVSLLGGAASGSDSLNIQLVAGAPTSGSTTIYATVINGVAIPDALLLIAFSSSVGVTPSISIGVGIGAPSYGAGSLTGFFYVRADPSGVLALKFNTASAAVLSVNISSVTETPGADVISFISP